MAFNLFHEGRVDASGECIGCRDCPVCDDCNNGIDCDPACPNCIPDFAGTLNFSMSDNNIAELNNLSVTAGAFVTVTPGNVKPGITTVTAQTVDGVFVNRFNVVVRDTDFVAVPAVESGTNHTVALRPDGTVWTWGRNNYGQLGNNTSHETDITHTPVEVMTANPAYDGIDDTIEPYIPLEGIRQIAVGPNHALALDAEGNVWGWGYNANGQLGLGDIVNRYVAVQVTGDEFEDANILMIATGDNHTLALEDNGTVWAWGRNAEGQLGDGSRGDGGNRRTTPAPVVRGMAASRTTRDGAYAINPNGNSFVIDNVIEIAAGGNNSAIIRSNGVVYVWGSGVYGQLGSGDMIDRLSPSQPINGEFNNAQNI
jgi:alpha-tubulin suppressor-like RCC1 family protein